MIWQAMKTDEATWLNFKDGSWELLKSNSG